MTNATIPATALRQSATIVPSLNQSLRSPSSRTYWTDPRPTANKTSPIPSKPFDFVRAGLRSSGRSSAIAMMPGTMLTSKTQRHETLSVRSPPRVGPVDGPTTAAIVKMAWLIPSCLAGNVSRNIACDVASKPPPNRPWTSRKTISSWIEPASPHRSEATVKPAIDTRKYCLRPKRFCSHGVIGMTTTAAMM